MLNKIKNRVSRWNAKRTFEKSLAQIFLRQNNYPQIQDKLKIGFLSQPGSFGSIIELFLAATFRAAGHDYHIIYVDESFPLLECHNHKHPESWAKTTHKNCQRFRKLARLLNLKVRPASSVPNTDGKLLEPVEFETIVSASLLRHYRVGKLNNTLADLPNRKRLFEASAKKSAAIGDYFANSLKVDRLILNHGLYATTGPARLAAMKSNLPVLAFDRTKRKGTLIFSWNESTD